MYREYALSKFQRSNIAAIENDPGLTLLRVELLSRFLYHS